MTGEPNPTHTPLLGNTELSQALDAIYGRAQRRIRIFDHTLGRDYNAPERCDILRKFLLSSRGNRLQIAVHDTRPLDRNCPRLLALLRTFGHSVFIHETHADAKSVYDPFAVVDDGCFVHRFHSDELRGLMGVDDPIGTHTLAKRFEEIWEASSPAVSATTLGL